MKIRTCAMCGKEFPAVKGGGWRYCSKACRLEANRLAQLRKRVKTGQPVRESTLEALGIRKRGPLTVAECHLCRSCRWAGKANGGAATVSCDYAFRTGELRGCEVSEHCERYERRRTRDE